MKRWPLLKKFRKIKHIKWSVDFDIKISKEKEMEEDHRPWGFYCVLADEPDHKVKRIVVYAGKRLSLQRHQQRREHWYFLSGQALVTRGEAQIHLTEGQSVDIPQGALHRIENEGDGNVVFIEVQTGDYFGEDDIERVEDDFGRG
jgi:mannose-6-phosphate isomerase